MDEQQPPTDGGHPDLLHPFGPPGEPVEAEVAVAPVEEPVENEAQAHVTNVEDEAVLVIQRTNGSGQREVSARKYAEVVSEDPSYVIVRTNYVGAHHSDNV